MDTHIPVLLKESVELLTGNGGTLYVDCTLGGGGHTEAILEKNPEAFVIGIDRDEEAIEIAQRRLSRFEGRYSLYQANFSELDKVLDMEGLSSVDGFLFDLGISMYQLRSERGFSFMLDAELDMRMDKRGSLTAKKVVNTYPKEKLIHIFKTYGEERFAGRIARAILEYRRTKPLERTAELVQLIYRSVPPSYRHGRIHPATRIFQALRIEVNGELHSLKEALEKTLNYLKPGGRLVVISFHSLEDRIVKRFMKEHSEELRILTKKPVIPSPEEVENNPASRSAKLRAGERVI
jgi:16S rRNA (cytosine1402-N4)-methyltransferase